MKKTVAFILCVLIFVAPVTTFVKADVVIGDNDETIINENATILGRKLALMESLSDLALSGVTEFTISNTSDVDSYLDYLWDELGDAIDSLSDGTGFTEISNNLKSKYFTNLVQYKDYITNRGNYLAQLLPSGSPTTTLLSTFFANNVYGKQYTQHYDLALDMFRSLSEFRSNSPTPNPDPDYTTLINIANSNQPYGFFWGNLPSSYTSSRTYYIYSLPSNNYSWASGNGFSIIDYGANGLSTSDPVYPLSSIYSLYITNSNDLYTGRIDNISAFQTWLKRSDNVIRGSGYITYSALNTFSTINATDNQMVPLTSSVYSGTLYEVMSYFCHRFKNINIYVNGVPWSIVGNISESNPTLDIDGLLKIYGNDNPQQYELQPQTKIDYDQLYQVIYNAIRDNLPISQGDINYYDSHDTIYSPTIINNYGEDEGDENDLIDTILDYAVIPKFDTAIAQPMREALTKGVVIMNTSITNVIPNEILLILGACFFLLLFAVVINRMIK